MSDQAMQYKAQGNELFAQEDYKGAEACYTKAILKNPRDAIFYTNRAFARQKLKQWEDCLDDCLMAIQINKDSMKAYFFLAEAQIELGHPNEALSSGLMAYDLCLRQKSPSAAKIAELILRVKKEKWAGKEKERMRRRGYLVVELEERLQQARESERQAIIGKLQRCEIDNAVAKEELEILDDLSRRKIDELKSVFALADPANLKPREVPDYLIDNITFNIMHDPVVTKNGRSYDRPTLLEHLRQSETDPLTREPLHESDLRPNLALKQACDEFLEANGWAVDW